MFFVVISIILLTFILLIANDIMFNRRRFWVLKILEFIVCISLIIYMFTNFSNYITAKNNMKEQIANNEILTSKMTIYNVNGTVEETTIGNFLYNNFVKTIFDDTVNTNSPEYLKSNIIICVVTGILIVYWIVLLLLFEKEEVSGYKIVEDEKLFEKYNPMIAACISQNRNIMCRDVVGVILNLINKGKINIRIVPDKSIKKVGYRYMISENTDRDIRIDMIEKEIYDWIFEEIPNFNRGKYNVEYISRNQEGIVEIDLIKRFEELSTNEDTYSRLKELNYLVKKRLDCVGANQEAVPFLLKMFNNCILAISLFLTANHIMTNSINISVTNLQVLYMMFALVFAIMILPLIYMVSLVCLEFIRIYFKTLEQITEGYTGRRLISKAISIILATFIIMIIYAAFANEVYIIYDILLLGVTCLVIFTDDYMLKHDYKILNDYYNLKRIENRISDYSLMKNENIEYVNMWDVYYAYAVAFEITRNVNKELEVAYENTNILTKPNLEGIYYVSKAYLEVMWDMEFYEKKSKINIFKFLK